MKNFRTVKLLRQKHLTISTAESMTGGMLAKYICDVPGISEIFDRGIVSYSNRSKQEELSVDEKIISTYGAISPQTAAAMADGLYLASQSDICISITGNAGPHPAEEKPVGSYYVGLRYRDKTTVYSFSSTLAKRNDIRREACSNMFELILSLLQN